MWMQALCSLPASPHSHCSASDLTGLLASVPQDESHQGLLSYLEWKLTQCLTVHIGKGRKAVWKTAEHVIMLYACNLRSVINQCYSVRKRRRKIWAKCGLEFENYIRACDKREYVLEGNVWIMYHCLGNGIVQRSVESGVVGNQKCVGEKSENNCLTPLIPLRNRLFHKLFWLKEPVTQEIKDHFFLECNIFIANLYL